MQEDNFERNARALMDDLRFRPSDPLWPKIADRIRKRKRRRILFFILPVAAALAVWLLSGPAGTGLSFPDHSSSREAADQPGNTSVPNRTDIPSTPSDKIPPAPELSATPVKEGEPVLVKEKRRTAVPKGPRDRQAPVNQPMMGAIRGDKGDDNNREDRVIDEPLTLTRTGILLSRPNNGNVQPIGSGSVIQVKFKKGNQPVIEVPPLSFAGELLPDRKLRWTLEFSPGISAFASKPGLVRHSTSGDYLANSPGGNTGGGSNGQAPFILTSPVPGKAGFSFQAGANAEKYISRRSSLSVGLLYTYSSDQLMIGNKVYLAQSNASFSSSGGVYLGNDEKAFTNQYHFLEIPVAFQYQLVRGESISVFARGGLSYSRLLYTNGLTYNSSSGGYYYHDNGAFNKHQLGILAGLGIGWGKAGRIRWVLGPQVKMALTPLRRGDFDQNKYLLSGGLDLRLLLPGKRH